jgi:NhaP-type Na+/H+ or K+/H+ antiporter
MVPDVLETIQALSLLTLMEIIGPILLGMGLIYGIVRTRRRSRAAKARTEAATRNLYRQEDAKERREEGVG